MPKTSDGVLLARHSMDIGDMAAGQVGVAIAQLGKKGLQHSEAQSAAKAKKEPKLIMDASGVLGAFFDAPTGRFITKAQILVLLREDSKNKSDDIKLKDVHIDQWEESMACRYRNVLNRANGYAKNPDHSESGSCS